MKSIPLAVLALGLFGASIGHSALQKSSSSLPMSMLDAYGALMNDWELLEKGRLGIERLRSDPSDLHQKRDGKPGRDRSASRERIRQIRDNARAQKIEFGDGLVRLSSGKIVFWFGSFAAPGPAYQIRAQNEIERTAKEAAGAIKKNPDLVFRQKLMAGTFVAKSIRYESAKCLPCHEGAKKNGVAAIAVAVFRDGLTKPRDVGGTIEQRAFKPEELLRDYGLSIYPNAAVTIPSHYYSAPQEKTANIRIRTNDSAVAVLAYYRKAIAKYPGAAMKEGSDWLSYEFGDDSFGQISTSDYKGETRVNLVFHRLKD